MSEKVKIFIELTRLNKPIGFMLLFWPCVWGLTISYDFSLSLNKYFKLLGHNLLVNNKA